MTRTDIPALQREEFETLPVYRHRVLGPPLADFVAVFWYAAGHQAPGGRERLLPTGASDLVIRLGNPSPSSSAMSGPRSRSRVVDAGPMRDRLLGVHFRAGGAFPFLGFPASDMHDLDVGLDALWGEASAHRLLDRLDQAPTVDMKFGVLEAWLLHRLGEKPGPHPAVHHALLEFRRDRLASVAALAAEAGLSQRRLSDLFRTRVGLGPKRFARLVRFRGALARTRREIDARGAHAVDWADLAVAGGYADQAHMIHEFREFGGFTPGRYAALRTPFDNHVRAGQ